MNIKKMDKWSKDFRNQSLLYFAQRVDEMLSPETDHIFKSPVLNTALLIDEYLKTADLVSSKTIDVSHLAHIMEEIHFSFAKDLVVKKYIKDAKRNQVLQKMQKMQKASIEECKALMEYLKTLLHDYNKWCKNFLFDVIANNEETSIIEHAIRCFIPGIIASGYSSDFIHSYNSDVFYKRKVTSIDSLRIFLNRFDDKGREYDVYIAIDNGAKDFQQLLENRLHIEFGPFPKEIKFRYNKNRFILARTKQIALDKYSAARAVYEHLNIFFSYYCYLGEQTEEWYYRNAIVVDSENNKYSISLNPLKSNRHKNQSKENLAKTTDFIILSLQQKQMPYRQINRALNMHNTAIKDSDIINQFLDFWAILEILFISDKNKPKIIEIIDKMIPVLLKDYLCYQFSSINSTIQELRKIICFKEIEDQISIEDKGAWPYFIVALDKYSDQLEMLCNKLKDYPLLTYRIKSLNLLCMDKTKLKDIIVSHSRRITWHIFRLYRARNTIIHAGMKPDNLYELVEHLHSYADQCFYEIVNILVYNKELKSISNALVEIQLRKDEIDSLLKNQSYLTRTELITILEYS